PHDADQLDEKALKVIADIAKGDKVVAIGETGLDFHYDNSPRPQQKKAFRLQIQLAQELGLPVIVHSREADEDTLRILQEEVISKTGGILHCFSSDRGMAEAVLELGMYIAFGGIITFKSAGSLREVVRAVPKERLLIETDAPYLTPEPHRGQRNEPAYVRYVAEEIARLKGISVEEIGKITSANAREIYRL
ncbi:MAG: TatD family hydrolase, partial [Halanaerobiales bacterium]